MAEQKINSARSDDAKHIAGAVFFMMRPGSSGLSYGMKESAPPARTLAALEELVAAGMLKKHTQPDSPAMRFEPLVDMWAYRKFGGVSRGMKMAEPINGGSTKGAVRLVEDTDGR